MKTKVINSTYVCDNLNVKFSRLISFNRDYLPIVIKYRQLSHKEQYTKLSEQEALYIKTINKLFSYSECKIINTLKGLKK